MITMVIQLIQDLPYVEFDLVIFNMFNLSQPSVDCIL